jgi:Phage tail sheath C-terminal domain
MAETFALSELVIPGAYIRVQAEALIGVGAVSTGNIGIVGTAAKGAGETHLFSEYAEVADAVGAYDAYDGGNGTLNLARGLEVAYRNGAGSVFARAVSAEANQAAFSEAFAEIVKEDVNILVAPELSTEDAFDVLGPVVNDAENDGKDVIAVVGSDESDPADIVGQVVEGETGRLILVAPGITTFDAAAGDDADLSGTYTAAAVAGLLSTLVPQSSPTNKVLPGVGKLTQRFSYGELKQLVNGRVCVLESRGGVRVVRGLTTNSAAFTQITTRRITDYAKAGIRQASAPFIGRLNNERVRKALAGAIDGFLTTMKVDEALISYELSVTATRQDEIAGRAIVNAVIRPTFSIDFVAVTLVLE